MDESFESFDVVDHDEQTLPKPRITLKLPSLKALKSQKSAKPPRPVKLKPLKEVIGKLIAQIRKKDDYAFFLHPVDVSQVPDYMTIVKRPMDFGTVTSKVAKGKYRSLEEFASDVRLVTDNAKAFNPPGSIYYTEAEKIEAYALDAIAKASSTVIQYETDWNIDVENEGDPDVNVEEDEDNGVPMDVDDPGPSSRRSQSVVSNGGFGPNIRRSTRAPYKKQSQQGPDNKNPISETIEADGRLPGSKDGLGAFPAMSDWAKTMLALKLKGKKYKTKKERLRFEKEGPPLHPDGSLDYWEMEEPFSVLSILAPEHATKPQVTPLYPPPAPQSESRSSATPHPQQPPGPLYPGAVTLSSKHETCIPPIPPDKKHWYVQRNYSSRGAKKDDERPPQKPEREIHTLDWGSLAVLAGELAEEMKRKGMAEDEESLELVRTQLDVEDNVKKRKHDEDEYWSLRRAADGESYLRDMVYGGIDGYAYVRSLAQFVKRRKRSHRLPDDHLELGMPLAQYVVKNVVDPLTEGQHALLRETVRLLSDRPPPETTFIKHEHDDPIPPRDSPRILAQIHASEYIYPLVHLHSQKIDLGSLIRQPEDVYQSEEVWEGRKFRKEETNERNAMALMETSEELKQVLELVEGMLRELMEHRVTVDKGDADQTETEEMKRLRLNLLALVKRTPVQLIAPLPKNLVHESVRTMIPGGE